MYVVPKEYKTIRSSDHISALCWTVFCFKVYVWYEIHGSKLNAYCATGLFTPRDLRLTVKKSRPEIAESLLSLCVGVVRQPCRAPLRCGFSA